VYNGREKESSSRAEQSQMEYEGSLRRVRVYKKTIEPIFDVLYGEMNESVSVRKE